MNLHLCAFSDRKTSVFLTQFAKDQQGSVIEMTLFLIFSQTIIGTERKTDNEDHM